MKLPANEATPGFTLIEIMVAVSLFAIVAVIVSGALITISDVNRKAQAIKLAMDNVAFAMDSMVANLREGAQFGCLTGTTESINNPNSIFSNSQSYLNNDCAGGSGIIFKSKRGGSANPGDIIYRFNENGNGSSKGSIQIVSSNSTPVQYKNLTSSEVNITRLSFSVPTVSASKNPTVTVVISGEVPGKNPTKFNLQTTVMANF